MAIHAQSTPKLGYDDYVKIPDDGLRHEIVDGVHFVNSAPSPYHQTVSRRIQFQLYSQLELTGLGEVYDAPVDVELSDHDIVQPDLVVVLAKNKPIIIPSRIKGIPDLLVEILSPSSVKLDRVHKMHAYEQTGVPEFWIVDPTQRTIEQYVLVDGVYQLQPAADKIELTTLKNIVVKLADVW